MDYQMTSDLEKILATVQVLAEHDFDNEAVTLLHVAMDFVSMNGDVYFPRNEVVVPLPKRKLAG